MKKIAFIMTVLSLSAVGYTQTIIPYPIPCVEVSPSNVDSLPSGVQATDCIEADGATVTFKENQNYSIRAGEYIELNPSTVITPDESHSFHAYIDNGGMDLAWYEPNTTPGTVGLYDKLEIGVEFNDSIQQKIDRFINKETGTQLNPFNPEDVDLYAEFWVEFDGTWYGPKRVNGFYYQEFDRNSDSIHWDTLETEHQFRIRYAPQMTGSWRCQVKAVVDGYDTLNAYEFTFDCVHSGNPGFVRVGDYDRYLKRGSEPFFPVGVNLTGPSVAGEWSPGDNEPVRTLGYYQFYDRMKELSETGANSFRYIASPWQTEIEFEALGDYSNRMSNAWEFDNILDSSDAYGLVMHFNMQMHYAFERPGFYGHKWWDWPKTGDPLVEYDGSPCFPVADTGYCYRRELDIEDPIDFFTDTLAMQHYKNRLRYMVARWGYSNDIGVMELMSEINNAGNETLFEYDTEPHNGCYRREDTLGLTANPYKDSTTRAEVGGIIADWQNEMCRFIKEDLTHTEHPLSVNYTGLPNTEHDDSYKSEYVDIATFNHYQLLVKKYEKNWDLVSGNFHGREDTTFVIDKPMLHSEYGPGGAIEDCDNHIRFIKMNTIAPFSGVAGAPYNWYAHNNHDDIWEYLNPISDFMTGIPLDEEFWFLYEPRVDTSNNNAIEIFVLRKGTLGEGSKFVGVVGNRTFNYYSQGIDSSQCKVLSDELDFYDTTFQHSKNYAYSDIDPDLLTFSTLGGMKDYTVEWYNALTGDLYHSYTMTTDIWGEGIIEFPDSLTGDFTRPILFFKVYPSGESFLAPEIGDGSEEGLPETFYKDEDIHEIVPTNWEETLIESFSLSVAPNPTRDIVNVTVRPEIEGRFDWYISSQQGQSLLQGNAQQANFTIDLSVLSSGMYFLTVYHPTLGQKTINILKQ